MRIGDHELPRDQARDIARDYAIRHRETVLWYDLAGDESHHPGSPRAAEPVNAVTLADVGRLVIINAGLRADDVPAMLTAADEQSFATELYDLFRRPGIGPVKRSKVLHLKRPWLVPIYDTHVHHVYEQRAADIGTEIEDPDGGWWEAARRDLLDCANDFAWLTTSLRADDDARVRRAGKLTELRLLDVLAWTLGKQL